MSNDPNLTGRWIGTYFQHDRPHPITAELFHVNQELSGSMRDDEPDTVTSVFEFAAQAGLPPGGDEQIVARLREMFPDAPEAPIRYVTHLPPESTLEGWVRGSSVYFLKTYRGDQIGGFEVGDRIVGHRIPSHAIHYSGKLSPDGKEIVGKWWIDSDPESGTRRIAGEFQLHR